MPQVEVGRAPGRTSPGEPRTSSSLPSWPSWYSRCLVLVDAVVLVAVSLLAVGLRFGSQDARLRGLPYTLVALALSACWVGVLAAGRCYERRFITTGPEEFRRVFDASVRLAAVVALTSYLAKLELARGVVAVALPGGLLLLLLGRFGARLVLHALRRSGRCLHRVLVVGTPDRVLELAVQLHREPRAGLNVVGACVTTPVLDELDGVPVVGGLADVLEAVRSVGADTVAITAGNDLGSEALRELTVSLEGTGVELLVAPALTNATGSRISIRPVAGLPLLHLDEPELSGARRLLKGLFDRAVALVGLLVLSPLLLLVAVLVRATSRGPALYRQRRLGLAGRPFTVWKFRSMVDGADRMRPSLAGLNEADGLLFKIREDPRITRVGRLLRATSIDELPQLVNVLCGQMSLVGPRPPLPEEVALYEGLAHRRLLVRPGMTGLWQVSGRSDLSWDDALRLDLQYVENWSFALDLSILAKTVVIVLRRRGAY